MAEKLAVKAVVWLTSYGAKRIAQGESAGADNFYLCAEELDMSVEGWTRIMEVVIPATKIPSQEACIPVSLHQLAESEAAARDALNRALAKINEERAKLLSLENRT